MIKSNNIFIIFMRSFIIVLKKLNISNMIEVCFIFKGIIIATNLISVR